MDAIHPKISTKWCKNFSLYWLAATGLAVWFLFVHSPPIIGDRSITDDPIFYIHMIGSYAIYAACIHNALITPSILRLPHIYIGRAGLLLGVVSFVSGFYLAWARYFKSDRAFCISISAGGILQIWLEIRGYHAIRRYKYLKAKLENYASNIEDTTESNDTISPDQVDEITKQMNESLRTHILSMLSLFVLACGIPAVIRAINESNVRGVWLILVVIGILTVIAILYGRAFTGRVFKQSPPVIDDSAPTSTIVTADQGKEQLDKEHTSLSSVLQDTPVHERKEMNL